MKPIYKTSGSAAEYAPYGLNLQIGCTHGCRYCYGPGMARISSEEWGILRPRKDILKHLDRQASKMIGFEKKVLLSFITDPYCTKGAAILTREALLILEKYRFQNVSILTKNPMRAVLNDSDLLIKNKWKLGITLIFDNEKFREEWEPNSSPLTLRRLAIDKALKNKIYTWISLEPVINSVEALNIIERLKPFINHWKIGKINHNKKLESAVDWYKFVKDVKAALKGCDYYLKESLRVYE